MVGSVVDSEVKGIQRDIRGILVDYKAGRITLSQAIDEIMGIFGY